MIHVERIYSKISLALLRRSAARDTYQPQAEHSKEKLERMARLVLGQLAKQAGISVGTTLRISQRESNYTYEYPIGLGRHARGTVHPLITASLRAVLDEASLAPEITLLDTDGQNLGLFKVTLLKDGSAELARAPLPLPQSPPDLNVLPFPKPPVSHVREEPSLVLVVDDNSTFVRVLERFFARYELKMLHASDGAAALSALSELPNNPDLVICDVHMPGMNGTAFLTALRENPRYEHLPVIILTSDDDIELKLKLIAAGADAYLTKNEDPRLLCVQSKRLIAKQRTQEAA